MKKTALGAAFETSGVRAEDVEFDVAISKYLNSGATIARALERVRLASEKMPGGGRFVGVSDGRDPPATAGQPVEGGEAVQELPQGQTLDASSSSNHRGGQGRVSHAPEGQETRALPVREPSPAFLEALGESRMESARSVLYRHKTSNGVWWGDVHPYEVNGMTRDSIRGMALMSAAGPLNSKQMKLTFAQLLKPAQALIAMEKANEDLADVK